MSGNSQGILIHVLILNPLEGTTLYDALGDDEAMCLGYLGGFCYFFIF